MTKIDDAIHAALSPLNYKATEAPEALPAAPYPHSLTEGLQGLLASAKEETHPSYLPFTGVAHESEPVALIYLPHNQRVQDQNRRELNLALSEIGTIAPILRRLEQRSIEEKHAKRTYNAMVESVLSKNLIRRGDAGDAVTALQRELEELEALPKGIATPGVFDKHTEDAVRQLQEEYSIHYKPAIAQDGVVGIETLMALKVLALHASAQRAENFWSEQGITIYNVNDAASKEQARYTLGQESNEPYHPRHLIGLIVEGRQEEILASLSENPSADKEQLLSMIGEVSNNLHGISLLATALPKNPRIQAMLAEVGLVEIESANGRVSSFWPIFDVPPDEIGTAPPHNIVQNRPPSHVR